MSGFGAIALPRDQYGHRTNRIGKFHDLGRTLAAATQHHLTRALKGDGARRDHTGFRDDSTAHGSRLQGALARDAKHGSVVRPIWKLSFDLILRLAERRSDTIVAERTRRFEGCGFRLAERHLEKIERQRFDGSCIGPAVPAGQRLDEPKLRCELYQAGLPGFGLVDSWGKC